MKWPMLLVGAALSLVCAAASGARAGAPPSAGLARSAKAYYLQPGDVVLLLGDAVTADGGYVGLVRADVRRQYPDLAGDGAKGVRFVNAGAAGETAGDGLRKLGDLVANHRPTVALVCFGLNDSRKDRAGYAGNVRAIVSRLRADLGSGRAVTLMTPPSIYAPGRPELEPYVKTLGEMTEELRLVAAQEGVVFADCYTPMKKRADERAGDFTWGDGLHPNDEGRRLMADALQKAWGFRKPLAAPAAPAAPEVGPTVAAAAGGGGREMVVEGPGAVVDTWLNPDFPAQANRTMEIAYVQAKTPDRMLVRFDLPPGLSAVGRAVLKLYVDEVKQGGYDVVVHKVKASWEADKATYVRPWKARGMSAGVDYEAGPVASARPGAPPSWVEFDVTRAVQAWCRGEPNRGLLVKASPGAPGGGRYRVRTTEADGNRPRLVLEGARVSAVAAAPATPAPAAPAPATAPARTGSGWTVIFNGRNLNGWRHEGGKARVEGGAIVASENADLFYAADWTEFVFSCEVMAGGGTSERPVGLGLAHTKMGRGDSRVHIYIHSDGDMHVRGGGGTLWRSGSGKFRLDKWTALTFELTREDLRVYRAGKLTGSVNVSGAPVRKGGVYFYANADHTARLRNARVRVTSR